MTAACLKGITDRIDDIGAKRKKSEDRKIAEEEEKMIAGDLLKL